MGDVKRVLTGICTWDQDLMFSMQPISGMTLSFSVTTNSRIKVSGHLDTKKREIPGTIGINDVVMVAAEVLCDGVRMPGSVTGENILSVLHHYSIMPLCGYVEVGPGDHTVQVRARSASDLATPKTADGLAEVKGDYNLVIVEVEPIEAIPL